MGGAERCELCGAPAAVHCAADAAFLCGACDAKVHGANFLASRHRRTRLHAGCDEAAEEGYESVATSSSCVSTADSSASTTAATRRGLRPARGGRGRTGPGPRLVAPRAEAVLEGWAKRMGLPAGEARRRAARALRVCGPGLASAVRVPLRVAMAAALWCEVAACSAGSVQGDALRRLEACAHVPARLVVAVASSMARARARRRPVVEGWDECSWAGPKSNPARS